MMGKGDQFMRGTTYLFLFACFLLAGGQSYVDSGILKYHSYKYNEALEDFKEAYEMRQMFTNSSVAKVFYYRGLTRFELIKSGKANAEADITLENVCMDLKNAILYDPDLSDQVENTNKDLYIILITEADKSSKQVRKENLFAQKIALLTDKMEYLNLARQLDVNSEINLLLGQAHKEIGDFHFEVAEDLAMLQLVKASYEEAIKYYEIARYDDPFSKAIIEDLLELSKRLDDQARVEEYEGLLKLAGG